MPLRGRVCRWRVSAIKVVTHSARTAGMLIWVILPKVRDPRLITIRRGGTLTDAGHQLLALWAAQCAEHVPYTRQGYAGLMHQRDR
jgi:hypothetical protein